MQSKILAISLSIWALSASAESVTIGQTYPIAERDALEEIEARVASVDWERELAPDNIRWSAKDGLRVPRATRDRRREFRPEHVLDVDVVDASGQVIYPRGFRYNVLDFVTLPYRVVVMDAVHVDWATAHLRPSDMVILTTGDPGHAASALARPAFLLDKDVRDALRIEAVPSIVEQSGNAFIVNEYLVEEKP